MNESGSLKDAGRYGHTALLVNRYTDKIKFD